MAKRLKSFYFRHDENAASDLKLMSVRSQLAMEGYGIYWFILEQLSMAGGRMQLSMVPMLANIMQTTADKAMAVVKNYNLFVVDGDGFFSERMNEELEARGALSEAGRTAGLKSAESRKLKALPPTIVVQSLNDLATFVEPVEDRTGQDNIQQETIGQIHGAVAPESVKKNSFEERKQLFRNDVLDEGRIIYTSKMLENFIGYWSEPNGAKNPKMKWERERDKSKNGGWELKRRLVTWATQNLDNIQCYNTESQKTIKQKQHDFAISLQKFVEVYDRLTVKNFCIYWTQPENTPEPSQIRWELEEFWDSGQRLVQWVSRNPVQTNKVA